MNEMLTRFWFPVSQGFTFSTGEPIAPPTSPKRIKSGAPIAGCFALNASEG
jgi:hypothetical protein